MAALFETQAAPPIKGPVIRTFPSSHVVYLGGLTLSLRHYTIAGGIVNKS